MESKVTALGLDAFFFQIHS